MTANDTLLAPLQLGAFHLAHRVVMPPTHRGRAPLPESAPDAAMVRYYGQRATPGGLVIAETAYICPAGHREPSRPGIYSIEQVNRWRDVTDAIHQRGGIVVAQLGYAWERPGAAADMDRVLEDYRSAAENASDAGFDGIELDATEGSLPAHATAHRAADSGATPLQDIVQTLCAAWEPSRIGLCVSAGAPPAALDGIGTPGLAYLRLAGYRGGQPVRTPGPGWQHVLLSGLFGSAEAAAQAVAAGDAAAIGFEVHFIAHPDLPARIRAGAPFALADETVRQFTNGAGYTDYPGWDGNDDGATP